MRFLPNAIPDRWRRRRRRRDTCCSTSGLSHGSTFTLYWGKSWTTRALCPWRIRLKMLRRPDMQTCPSAAINTWLAFTLLQSAAVSNSGSTDAITAETPPTGARIPCGGCIPALSACPVKYRQWSTRSSHRRNECRLNLWPTLENHQTGEDETWAVLNVSAPQDVASETASCFLTIRHEGRDDPQLVFSYEDALVG